MGTVVSVALAAGGYFLFVKGQEKVAEASAPELGVCLKMTGTSLNADHRELSCDDPGATYRVIADDGECDKREVNYTITSGSISEGNVADLCLVLNAAEGDCFRLAATLSTSDEKVDCKSTAGDATVAKVVELADNASADCPKGATALRNKTRDILLCVEPNA